MNGEILDMLIIGGGPAGLSAAVNAKARNKTAMLLDHRGILGKVRTYPEVTNYLGFPRASGDELANHFAQHFSKTGYQCKRERVLKILPQDDVIMTSTNEGVHQSRTVVLAIGVAQTKVLPGEEEYLGRGVSYCVTCDGALFRGKDVVVAGYIHEGEEEANALAGLARSVTYVAAYPEAKTLDPSVKLVQSNPLSVQGDAKVRGLTTEEGEFSADGIFIIREAIPVSTLLDGLEMSVNYIQVNREMATNIAGIYAAGDCIGPPFQIAKAVGEGQVAALSAARYISGKQREES